MSRDTLLLRAVRACMRSNSAFMAMLETDAPAPLRHDTGNHLGRMGSGCLGPQREGSHLLCPANVRLADILTEYTLFIFSLLNQVSMALARLQASLAGIVDTQ